MANDLMVFVAPGGLVAEEWSELALAPATEAELGTAIAGEVPVDHYVAVVQLHDGGVALLCEPGGERFSGRVVRSAEGRIRFGMAPSPTSSLWVGSGVVGASGVEIAGFGLAGVGEAIVDVPDSEMVFTAHATDVARKGVVESLESEPADAQPFRQTESGSPDPDAMLHDDVTVVDLPTPGGPPPLFVPTPEEPSNLIPPPPVGSPVGGLDLPPPPVLTPEIDPPVLDPPVLTTSLFPDLPIEEPPTGLPGNPIMEREPTPPPPGLPITDSQPDRESGRPVSLIFDDGQSIPLTSMMAIGRAPEGSEHAPPGCVVVVVAGDQVSRCHFLIRPTEFGAEVVDTNSLNGCFVDYPDRPGTGPQIPVGVPVPIEPGQQFRFGDRSLTLVDRS